MIHFIDDDRARYEALSRFNYFPNQKSAFSEIPPSITSRQFTPEVCEALAELEHPSDRRGHGYDLVEYRSTRFNNVPRVLSLPHPKPQAELTKHICENWDKISHITDNKCSLVKPELHADGRIIVMNYEDPSTKRHRYHSSSFSKFFRVHSDISNCFNSIYTHSLPWAVIGIAEAKKNRNPNEWFNKLDTVQRNTKRNETQGILIGPATSNIFVELVLHAVDKTLRENGYQFHRYIDDYTCFCETSEEAQMFIHHLSNELSKYRLTLNLSKTEIISLPHPADDAWVLELHNYLPNRYAQPEGLNEKLMANEVVSYLGNALNLNKSTPDGSVLKYAIHLIIDHVHEDSKSAVFSALLELSFHYPVLIPYLQKLIESGPSLHELGAAEFIEKIAFENVKRHRSDGISWPLHILKTAGIPPSNELSDAILKSRDCLALTLLSDFEIDRTNLIEFCKDVANADNYSKDNYWLLLYQMYIQNELKNPYNDSVFATIQQHDVNFVPNDTQSRSEQVCDEIQSAAIARMFNFKLPD
ncbi:antiviral reverse transcriptase Drt4 [Thalassospira alkalitolerans]|uniref:antiviral reverse transcriptase Drt4 n=1 Tax=Thalassospira alkalitolerans TaxID=1293890 RepID=UPI003AA8A2FA